MTLGKVEKAVLQQMNEGTLLQDYWGSKGPSVVSVKGIGIINPRILDSLHRKKLVSQIKSPHRGRMQMTSYYGLTELGRAAAANIKPAIAKATKQ